jgi:hypothetical protein
LSVHSSKQIVTFCDAFVGVSIMDDAIMVNHVAFARLQLANRLINNSPDGQTLPWPAFIFALRMHSVLGYNKPYAHYVNFAAPLPDGTHPHLPNSSHAPFFDYTPPHNSLRLYKVSAALIDPAFLYCCFSLLSQSIMSQSKVAVLCVALLIRFFLSLISTG